MQKVLIGFLAITTAALSILCGALWQQARVAREQARAMEQARAAETDLREAQSARVKELERSEARLERQLQEFSKVTTTLRATEAAQSSNLTKMAERMRTTGPKAGGAAGEGENGLGKGMGEMLGKMMKDPAMREMMREQQKAAINMMYSGLFKEMNLAPEEKDKLKALLTDAQMRNIENAQGLFGDGKVQSSNPEQDFATAKKETDEQIKALLGEERFAQYEDYQKNMGERMQLDQLKNQLAGENMPLRDDQTALLLQIMKDQKAAVPPAIPSDQSQMPKKEFFTAEKIEEQTRWMEEYNRSVADQVKNANVLTPEQLKAFLAHQEQQLSMQKLGLNMARQMFGGKSGDTAPVPEK